MGNDDLTLALDRDPQRDEAAAAASPQAAAEVRRAGMLRMRRAVTHTDLPPDQPPAAAAAEVPEGEEGNPYAQFRGDPRDDGVGLLERQRLNRQEAFYRGSLAGSTRLSLLANIFRTPDEPGLDPARKRVNNGLRDEYRGIVADLAAHDILRPWGTTLEGAAAMSGQLEGSMLSPESWLGWGAKGANIVYRTGKAALQQGAIQAATDPLVQVQNIRAGVQTEYNPLRTAAAFGTGATIGAGMHVGGELLSNVIGQALLRKQLRELGRDDPAFLGIVPQEELHPESIGAPPGAISPDKLTAEALARGRHQGEQDHMTSPGAAMEPEPYAKFKHAIADVPPEIQSQFQVHGVATGDRDQGLIDLLEHGIDPARPFQSGPPTPGSYGVDTTRVIAPYLILSDPGKTIPETGIKNVVVNGAAERNIEALRQAWPGINFMTAEEAAHFMKTGEAPAVAAPASKGASEAAAPAAESDTLAGTVWTAYKTEDRLRRQIAEWRAIVDKDPNSEIASHLRAMAEDAEKFLEARRPAAAPGEEPKAAPSAAEAPPEGAPAGGAAAPAEARAPATAAAPATGRPSNIPSAVPDEIFTGGGREERGAAYNPAGAAVPIAGPGRYFSFSREHAATFGPNVERASIGEAVQSPLVITDGAQWRALTREAGWEMPNPFGKPEAELQRMTARLQEVVKAKGHDGLVVWWNDASPGDVGPRGENIKLLRNVFDQPQVISYRERPVAVPAQERITAAGVQAEDGTVFTGINHSDAAAKAEAAGHKIEALSRTDGFVTSTGRYVDRLEAKKIADAADQVKPSEDSIRERSAAEKERLMAHEVFDEAGNPLKPAPAAAEATKVPAVTAHSEGLPRPSPGAPAVDVGGVRVTFPDRDHVDLFELGRKIREGEKLSAADVERLFERFKGHVVTDPEFGIEFRNWRDLGALARDYFDSVKELAARGVPFEAHDVVDPDAKEAWYRRALAGDQAPAQTVTSPSRPGVVIMAPTRKSKIPELIGESVRGMAPHRVSTPDGSSVEVAPIVVEAADLVTSADTGYDGSLQPRQRERAASQAQIREIATRLEPERLGASAEADRGAPIVGPDSMVESGNGRVLAVRRAYEQGGEAALRYREWLAGQGVDVSGYREPVLVRQRVTALNPEDRRRFTVAANQAATLTLSASERAAADARHVDGDMLGLIRNADDLGAAANRDFVRAFVAKLPQAEQGAMTTAEGGLSAEGLGRIRNAVLVRAYGDAGVLARVAEATSGEIKSISNALVTAAPDWAKLRTEIEAGRVRADVDLTAALLEAVSRTADLRAKGVKLDAHLAQQDAFDRLSAPVETFMRMFYDPAGRRAAGGPRIADALRFYAEEARKVTAEAGLDLGLPEVSAHDIQRAAQNRSAANEARAQQGGLFLRGGTGDGASGGTAGRQVPGRQPVEGGARVAEPGAGGAGGGAAGPSAGELNLASKDTWRSVLDVPEVKAAIDNPQIERAGTVPYGAGADASRPVTHIDEHIPPSIDVRRAAGGGTAAIDPAVPLNIHEQVEKYVMEKLIAQGVPREKAYLIAHHHFADPAERAWVEEQGLDWRHYSEIMAGLLDHVEHERAGSPPAGLYLKPYPHDRALLLAREEPGGARPIGPSDELALAERRGGGTLRMERRRPGQGVPEAAATATGLPAPVAPAPSPQQTVAIRSLQQQAFDLADALGFPLREGRVRARNALGVFNTGTGVVRVKEVPDFEVVAHEGGHAIEAKAGQPLTNLTEQFRTELAPLVPSASYAPDQHVKEGFAEFIRRYIGNPAHAEQVAPGFTIAFRDFMSRNHPDMLAAIDRAGEAYRAYLDAPSVDAVGTVRRSQDENLRGWQKLRQQIADNGFPGVIKSFFQWAYGSVLDDKAPVARAVRDLGRAIRDQTGDLVQLKAADNPEVLMRLRARAQQAAVRDMLDGVRPYQGITPEGPSLADGITKAIGEASVWGKWDPDKKADFSAYLIARRADVLWDRFRAGDLPNPPTAFSQADARVAIADFERANPGFREGADIVHQYTRQLLRKQFESGLIDADLYRRLLRETFYVPFMRDMSDKPMTGTGFGSSPDGPGMTDTVKRIKGSTRDIKDPIESIMMQTFLVNRTIRHNDVIRSFVSLARRAGIEGGNYVEPIPAHEAVKYTVNVSGILERKLQALGIDADEARMLSAQVGDMFGEDPIMGSYFKMEPAGKRGEPIVFYKEGGQLKAARFMAGAEGHALYETLTAASEPITDLWVDLIRGAAVIKRSGIVTNPTFAISNYVRDQVAASILRSDYIPIASGLPGLVSEVRQGQSAQLYGYAGGVAGGASTGPVERAAEAEVDALAKKGYAVNRLTSFKGLLELASVTEAGTRNSVFGKVFEAKKRQGLSDYEAMIEAAFQAQDLLDFSRHGSHTLIIRQLLPFLNAHIQGLDKAWRTIVEPIVTKLQRDQVFDRESGEFRNAIAAAVKVSALGGALGAVWAAVNWEKEAYRDASPYFKGAHFIVPFGNKIAVVPKPFELSLGFTAGEYAFARLMKDDPRAAGQFIEAAWQTLAPPSMITDIPVLSTATELYLGKSLFTGRDIVPGELQKLKPEEQFNDRTSEVAKWLGQVTGVSPMKIDYGIGSQFGTWGRDIMALSSGVDKDSPALNMEDRVLLRRFIKDPTRTSDITTKFWNFMGQTTGVYNQDVATYDSLVKGFQDDKAKEFLDRLPAGERAFVTLRSAADEDGRPAFHSDDRRLHPLQRAYDAVSVLNGLRKELSANAFKDFETLTNLKMDDRTRRDLIDNVRELAQTEMRNALVILKEPGYANRPVLAVNDTMTKIRALSPAVANEIATRYATGKIYTTAAVQQAWPILRDELARHGSQADVADLALDAKAEGYEFGGERVKRPAKRRLSVEPVHN